MADAIVVPVPTGAVLKGPGVVRLVPAPRCGDLEDAEDELPGEVQTGGAGDFLQVTGHEGDEDCLCDVHRVARAFPLVGNGSVLR